jgi:ABC-type multidrug transport system ATPase subunit
MKRFGDLTAVDNLTLGQHREVFGFLGPNEVGKTTTVRTLSAILASPRRKRMRNQLTGLINSKTLVPRGVSMLLTSF